jgi:hypothetical protein
VTDAELALLSGQALGALTPGEADQAERLITLGGPYRRAFEEALETAPALAPAMTDAEPPPELRARILGAVRGLPR